MMVWGHATGVAVTGVCFAIVAVMWIVAYVTKGWVPNRPMKKCR